MFHTHTSPTGNRENMVRTVEFYKILAFPSVVGCAAGVTADFLKIHHIAPYRLLGKARCRLQLACGRSDD
jgi:hypothetical protein